MKLVQKGQKISLKKEFNGTKFEIGINWDSSLSNGYEIDSSLMMLSDLGKLETESDFIFYNNKKSLDESISLENNNQEYKKLVNINTDKIKESCKKIILILTIDNGDKLNQRFGNIKNISISLIEKETVNIKYNIEGLTNETAIILCEIYFRNGEWKFNPVGNGFNSGLAEIIKQYGSDKIKVSDEPEPQKETPIVDNKLNYESNKTSTISLEKITLDKKGDSTKIDLTKKSDVNKEIKINLNWSQNFIKQGFFKKKSKLDLDLGCMFEMKDGTKGVIQALGNNFGSKNSYPYIFLDKDDRSGNSIDGENMIITKPELIKRVLIYAFIYQGSYDFRKANAYLTLNGLNQEIVINLDSSAPYLTFCIGSLIENNNNEITIKKINEYVKGHQECDKMFKFNFNWKIGQK